MERDSSSSQAHGQESLDTEVGLQPNLGRACTSCATRKIKCDRQHPICSSCVKFRKSCTYPDSMSDGQEWKGDSAIADRSRSRTADGDSGRHEAKDETAAHVSSRKRKLKTAGRGNSEVQTHDHALDALRKKVKLFEDILKDNGVQVERYDPRETNQDNNHDDLPQRGANVRSMDTDSDVRIVRVAEDREADENIKAFKGDKVGQLVQDKDGSLYLEHKLWIAIKQEHSDDHDDTPTIQTFNEKDGNTLHSASNHPTCSNQKLLAKDSYSNPQSFVDISLECHDLACLVDLFFENCHPLTGLLHVPTARKMCETALADLRSARASHLALLHSICACALVSLSPTQSRNILSRTALSHDSSDALESFQACAQRALVTASYLRSSDAVLLQAYMLLLTSKRTLNKGDPISLWTEMGTVIRMAQRMGFHRDGQAMGLSSFETELRRRVWWYIVDFDSKVTELSGCSTAILIASFDTKLPSNLDDIDNHSTSPNADPLSTTQKNGFSDSTFYLVRYHIVAFGKTLHGQLNKLSSQQGKSEPGGNGQVQTDLLAQLDELEDLLESEFLRFCDPVVPLQNFTTIMARFMLCKLRHIITWKYKAASGNPSVADFSESALKDTMKILEHDSLAHSFKALQRFVWYARAHFPYGALIKLLKQLESCTLRTFNTEQGTLLKEAWELVEEVYHNHPEFFRMDNVISVTTGKTALESWKAFAAHTGALSQRERTKFHKPDCIQQLELTMTPGATANREGNKEHKTNQTAGTKVIGLGTNVPADQVPMLPYHPLDGDFSSLFGPDESFFANIDWFTTAELQQTSQMA